jgi:hypothetical protein
MDLRSSLRKRKFVLQSFGVLSRDGIENKHKQALGLPAFVALCEPIRDVPRSDEAQVQVGFGCEFVEAVRHMRSATHAPSLQPEE